MAAYVRSWRRRRIWASTFAGQYVRRTPAQERSGARAYAPCVLAADSLSCMRESQVCTPHDTQLYRLDGRSVIFSSGLNEDRGGSRGLSHPPLYRGRLRLLRIKPELPVAGGNRSMRRIARRQDRRSRARVARPRRWRLAPARRISIASGSKAAQPPPRRRLGTSALSDVTVTVLSVAASR